MHQPSHDVPHQPRLNLGELAPATYRALGAADAGIRASPLNPHVRELVKIRASQINGCIYCVDMHVREARQLGEPEERMHQLVVWRESRLFSREERAALAYTEAVTTLSAEGVSDAIWDAVKSAFNPEALAALVAQVALINAFNRIGVPLRMGAAVAPPKHG